MRIAIISAVVGRIDDAKELPEQHSISIEVFPHFFSENDVPRNLRHLNHRTQALYFKTQMHQYLPDYDLYIWIDGKIKITSPDFVNQCVDQLGNNDLAILKHHERTCVYQEINHILHCMSKGNEYLLTRYKDRPLKEEAADWNRLGYPANNGLGDCKIFIVRNSERIKDIFAQWWFYVFKMNYFDQTAIQGLCWLNGIKIHYLNLKPGSFEDVPHAILK